ncbi:MAG: hypothetical protein IKD72_09850 [Clostridia bacterium]|nr:hypothetical protein [Clostridia bacterium]
MIPAAQTVRSRPPSVALCPNSTATPQPRLSKPAAAAEARRRSRSIPARCITAFTMQTPKSGARRFTSAAPESRNQPPIAAPQAAATSRHPLQAAANPIDSGTGLPKSSAPESTKPHRKSSVYSTAAAPPSTTLSALPRRSAACPVIAAPPFHIVPLYHSLSARRKGSHFAAKKIFRKFVFSSVLFLSSMLYYIKYILLSRAEVSL